MIGIQSVGIHVPDNKVDNIQQGEKFGENEDFIRNKIGAVSLPRLESDEDTSDLAVKAVNDLLSKTGLEKDRIAALVVVTQNGDFGGLPHTSAIVQSKLGLGTNVSAFDLSLGCSGYVYGLSVLKAHMIEMGYSNAVLITADPYSKILDADDRVTSLLFGDCATATLLSENPVFEIHRPVLQTNGDDYDALVKDGLLSMNGRKVFNFAAVKVPEQIRGYLEQRKLTVDDIDKFLLHQGSAAIVEVIARKLGGDADKFPLDILDTGNAVSSSIPLLLAKEIENKDVKKIIASGFGVGLSWATNLLERI